MMWFLGGISDGNSIKDAQLLESLSDRTCQGILYVEEWNVKQ